MSDLLINNKPVLLDVEAVIFDKDGTLIDVHHYWTSMLKIRARLIVKKYKLDGKVENELMGAMGIDAKTGKIKIDGPVGIKPRPFIVSVAAEVLNSNNVTASHNDIEGIFLEVDKKTSDNILPLLKLLPGVERLLEGLDQCGIIIMLATTDMTMRARLAMRALNIEHFFSEIIGGDAVDFAKPSPDLALNIIEKTGVDQGKVAIVGDHPVDIKMGVAASLGCNIGVLTGLSNSDLFSELDCFVVESLEDIGVKC
ncbi:MAG: HAD family hydrolase [Methylococcales bacterium]|jgi:phosphoglycolate phosphatase|nr:HAD family hydrolase [Methylococcales bacterium]